MLLWTVWEKFAFRVFLLLLLSFFLIIFPSGCSKQETGDSPKPKTDTLVLNGAGATFPFPLYSKWFDKYYKLHPKVQINYQSIGSGGGIKQIIAGTIDFGASDAPMKDEELQRAPAKILHVPTALGSVVITYNIKGVSSGLKLTPQVLVDILMGKITKWNDGRITGLNPGMKIPAQDILVVYRTDGSGTTSLFTDYLSKVSARWENEIGHGKVVSWPTGIGAKGNEGVAGQIKQTAGTIGYVELAYAEQNKMTFASLKNRAGKFVFPSLESTTASAKGAASQMPEDMRVSITNAPGEDTYPISGYTYLLIYQNQTNRAKGEALVKFLEWAIHDGAAYTKDLYYAPLPEEIVARVEQVIKTITY